MRIPVSPANEYFVAAFVIDQVGGPLSVCNKRAGERARSLMASPLLSPPSPVHLTVYRIHQYEYVLVSVFIF